MAMSIYSMVGIAIFIAVGVVSIIVKVTLRTKRRKLDGAQGFTYQSEEKQTKTDDWELL